MMQTRTKLNILSILDLGRRDFTSVWEMQKDFVAKRIEGEITDTLILVEHEDVLTCGRGAKPEELKHSGLPVFEIERGGEATYHGPGQLVAYPVLLLNENERDVHNYLRRLEDVLIHLLAKYALAAERNLGLTGVWVGRRKIASIGVALRRWVTYHGLALNVSTDLNKFRGFNPCGLNPNVMTTLEVATGQKKNMDEVKKEFVNSFKEVFGFE